MTFEPIDRDDDDADDRQPAADGPSLIARFRRYLAARRDAGLDHRDPDTTETERLWP